jgi:predicted MFS family arabinose efflux permease
MSDIVERSSHKPGLVLQLATSALIRFLVNTSRRFPAPFALALSRGLGVPLTAITSLVAANHATGLLGPLFGPLSDRYGYRTMMVAGLVAVTVGMLAVGLLPTYGVVMGALFLAGLGKVLFDPSLQAYVGERVPYRRRGLAIGLMEYSWSATTLLGLPLIGLLIERRGWRAPFFVIGLLAVGGGLLIAWAIPKRRAQGVSGEHITFGEAWRRLRGDRAVLGVLGFALFTSTAINSLFVTYGPWLEVTFGLTTAGVGLATTAIGIAEILGESLTASLADRIGLKRAVTGGVILSGVSYVLLPLVGRTLPLAVIGLFVVFITFEFMMVSSFSLYTAIRTDVRATVLSSTLAAISLGGVIGSLVGGRLWLVGGLLLTGVIAAILSLAALLSLLWGLRHWQPGEAA